MTAPFTFEDHVDGLSTAAARLAAEVGEAGLDVPVPTCAGWTTAQLVAHTGMVHRWAMAALRGERLKDTGAVEQEGLSTDDPLGWLIEGAERLGYVLRRTPQNADVWFFLHSDLSPRDGWARRQCHETTIHAIDALAARRGAPAPAVDIDLASARAVDGVDELLRSFAPRVKTDLKLDRQVTIEVMATDTGDNWTLRLGPGQPAAERGLTNDPVNTRWSGSALDLYLGLWNRGGHIAQEGDPALGAWRGQMHVRW